MVNLASLGVVEFGIVVISSTLFIAGLWAIAFERLD